MHLLLAKLMDRCLDQIHKMGWKVVRAFHVASTRLCVGSDEIGRLSRTGRVGQTIVLVLCYAVLVAWSSSAMVVGCKICIYLVMLRYLCLWLSSLHLLLAKLMDRRLDRIHKTGRKIVRAFHGASTRLLYVGSDEIGRLSRTGRVERTNVSVLCYAVLAGSYSAMVVGCKVCVYFSMFHYLGLWLSSLTYASTTC
jgi:hypothetical protein